MENSRVLPILSDPRSADGDGDEIADKDDKRPLLKETLETMYKLHESNNPSNPIYLEIKDNTVYITANLAFSSDIHDVFPDEKNSNNLTFSEAAAKGIEEKWTTDITGTYYDFIEGLKGNIVTKVNCFSLDRVSNKNNRFIEVSVNSNDESYILALIEEEQKKYFPVTFTYSDWTVNCKRGMKLFLVDGRNGIRYNLDRYKAVSAHEFGHCLGLSDAYPEQNNGNRIRKNDEIQSGIYPNCSLMFDNGYVNSNDVEMVLEAFTTNIKQYPLDLNNPAKPVSKAIKLPQTFEKVN